MSFYRTGYYGKTIGQSSIPHPESIGSQHMPVKTSGSNMINDFMKKKIERQSRNECCRSSLKKQQPVRVMSRMQDHPRLQKQKQSGALNCHEEKLYGTSVNFHGKTLEQQRPVSKKKQKRPTSYKNQDPFSEMEYNRYYQKVDNRPKTSKGRRPGSSRVQQKRYDKEKEQEQLQINPMFSQEMERDDFIDSYNRLTDGKRDRKQRESKRR